MAWNAVNQCERRISEGENAAPHALGTRKKGEPRCLRPLRYNKWLMLGVDVLAASAVFCAIRSADAGSFPLLIIVPQLVAVSLVEWVKWHFYVRYRKRLLTEVIEHELAACLQCGYALLGLPEEHRCPECGTPYHLAATKRTWERWFASDSRGQVSQVLLESFHQHLQDARRMRDRLTCIRCGHALAKEEARVCPACGAAHEVPESPWAEHQANV